MADLNDAAKQIGFLLGGGGAQMRAQAFDEGRLNTAKTEDALANARDKRLQAQARATKIREAEKFEEVAVANGMPASQAAVIGNLIRSEGGSDFSAGMTGLETQQEMGFRDTLASMESTPEERLRAGFGVQGKVSPDIAPVGTHGVVDLTQEDQKLFRSPGSGTTAMRNFEYSQELPPEQREAFSPFVRADQILQVGGVPTPRAATTGTTKPAVSAEDAAANAAAIAEGKKTGVERAAQKTDYPQARFTLDQSKLSLKSQNDLVDELVADDQLWQRAGLTQLVSKIPGMEGAYIRSKIDVLSNKAMLATLLNLRAMSKTGGAVGNVSDREGETMRSAIAAINAPNITAGDLRKELLRLSAYNKELEANLDSAFNATYDAQGNPLLGIGPRGVLLPEEGQPSIEEIIVNEGLGEYNETGDLVDGRGWIFMKDAQGNGAWVSPDGTQFEEVAQ